MSSPSLAEPYSRRKLLQLRKYAKNSVHVNLSTMAENLVLFEEPQLPSPRARVPSYTGAQGTGLPPAHTRRPSNVARTNLGGIQGVLSPSIHAGNGLIATPPVAARRPRLENAEGPSRLKPSTSIGRLPNFQEELPLDPARPKHGPLRSDQASNWRQRDHPGGKDASMDETPTHWDEDEDPPAINGKPHENHSYNGHGPKDPGLSSLNGFSADPLLSKRPLGSLFAVEDPLLSKRSFSSPGIPPDRQALESPKPQPQHQLFDPAIASLGSPGLPPGLQAPPPSLAQRLEEVLWQYRDPSGTVQGPFSALQMHEWYLHQYFAGDLFVKPQYQAHFETLDAWTLRLAPAHRDKPFLSAPPSHAPVASSLPSPSVSHHLGNVGHPVQSTHHPAYQASRVRQFTSNYDPFQATPSTGPIISHGSTYDPPQPLQQATDPWGVPLPRVKPTEPARAPSQDPFFQPQALQSAVASSTIRAESPLQALHASSVPVSRDAWQSFSRDSIDDKGPIGPQGVQAIGQPISRSVSNELAPTESLLASLNELQDDDQIEDAAHSATPPTPGKASPSQRPAPIEKPAAPIKASAAPVQPAESPKSAKQQKKEAKKVNGGIHVTPSKVVVIPAGTPTKSAPPQAQSQPPAPAEDKKPIESPAAVPSAKLNAPWVAKESPAQPTHPAQPSLREIQAREAKEEQLRKAAEKKAKAAALAAEQAALAVKAAQEAEAAHITQSTNWTTKSNGASTPVWQSTGAASASPKTLKEIQEEEARQQQRRAQALKQAQANGPAAAAAALRGYARSVDPSKVTAPAGAPWSTVGSSGKSVPSSQATPAAATPRSVTATPVTVSKPATPVPASRPLSAKRLAASDKAEATNQPSGEFMRWCRSALQGLTVPMDEFIQMLLTFPVQADAGTLEIISDMVYANSPNLDGRRFAETFALKRKADAGMSLKGKQPQVPPAPPIVVRSAADAVKSQPKKEEVLPFKVVQGKKKR